MSLFFGNIPYEESLAQLLSDLGIEGKIGVISSKNNPSNFDDYIVYSKENVKIKGHCTDSAIVFLNGRNGISSAKFLRAFWDNLGQIELTEHHMVVAVEITFNAQPRETLLLHVSELRKILGVPNPSWWQLLCYRCHVI